MSKYVNTRLAAQYNSLWETMVLVPCKINTVLIAHRIDDEKSRYIEIVEGTQIPWYFVGVLHYMLSGLNLNLNMDNGTSLTGRPNKSIIGCPFVESGKSMIKNSDWLEWQDWSLAGMLYQLHLHLKLRYNSSNKSIVSPFLWLGTEHKRLRNCKSVGAAVILKRLVELDFIELPINQI